MPLRLEPFVNDSIHHVFNRTIDEHRIFEINDICLLLLQLWGYYRSAKAKVSFSKLKELDKERLERLRKKVRYKKYFRVDILAYCLMPSHYHLLLKQKKENGIQRFMSDTINSLTRTFNLRNKRKGPLLLPKFKSVQVQTDEQLIHVSRYIHLNPYSSGVVKKIIDLADFPWSSLKEYLFEGAKDEIRLIDTSFILSMFSKNRLKYKKFVYDNAQYQKTIEQAKYAERW